MQALSMEMTTCQSLPPPSVLDQWANENPARLYAVAPHAYAVDITARWFTGAFGPGDDSQRSADMDLSYLR